MTLNYKKITFFNILEKIYIQNGFNADVVREIVKWSYKDVTDSKDLETLKTFYKWMEEFLKNKIN